MPLSDPVRFEVRYSFEVSGRGVVLGGSVLAGIVRVGMRLRLTRDSGEILEAGIRAVEIIDRRRDREADIGLILDEADPERRALWRSLGNAGFVATVTEPEGTTTQLG